MWNKAYTNILIHSWKCTRHVSLTILLSAWQYYLIHFRFNHNHWCDMLSNASEFRYSSISMQSPLYFTCLDPKLFFMQTYTAKTHSLHWKFEVKWTWLNNTFSVCRGHDWDLFQNYSDIGTSQSYVYCCWCEYSRLLDAAYSWFSQHVLQPQAKFA